MTDREQFDVWFTGRWPEFSNSRESAFACWEDGRAAECERCIEIVDRELDSNGQAHAIALAIRGA